MTTSTDTKVIKIMVKNDASAPLQKIAKNMSKLNKETKKTNKNLKSMGGMLGKMKTMFAGLVAAMGVRELTRSADAFQLIKDRIRSLWGEGENAEEIFKKISKVANETNAPIETLADGFARLSISSKDMGMSVDETIKLVTALRQSLRLSGASTAETNSVFLQFSQAMGLGRLQGQELRAVMLGNAEGAKILADTFNTTKGMLRDFGEKGLLVADKVARGFIDRLGDLNKRANMLKVTFGQAMIKLLDAFRIQIDKINSATGASSFFGKGIQTLIKNMDALLAVTTAIAAGAVLYQVAAGITAIGNALAGKSLVKLGLMLGPKGALLLGLSAVAGMVTYIAMQEKPVTKTIDKLLALNNLEKDWLDKQEEVRKKLSQISSLKANQYDTSQRLAELQLLKVEEFAADKAYKRALKLYNLDLKSKKVREGATAARLSELQKLNALFKKNGDMKEYIRLLRELKLSELDKTFEKGKMSIIDFNEKTEKINKTFDDLLVKMDDIANKDNVFHGIQRGAEATIKSVGTVAEEIAGATEKAFSHLEDNLVEFTKTGRFEFRKFAQAILDDINRMVIRMSIIKPLAGALSGAISGGAETTSGTTSDYSQFSGSSGNYNFAKGGAFNKGNVIPFANGGVVTSPTTFGMSGGRTGLMGEAGNEAILPLSRGPGGKLGVTGSGTIVNVINNSSEVETETRRSNEGGTEKIDVYIVNKVSEAIGEGQFDRSFQQLYGLNRQGV